MNKTKYKKYVEKTDPKKYSEIQSHRADIQKYRGTIINMTDDLLENPDKQITTEINEIFEAYSKTIIRYLKNKELEKTSNYSESVDDDILFGEMDENVHIQSGSTSSFWSGERVVKKQNKFLQKDISKFGVISLPHFE